MKTVFVDESGYTGADLLNPDQPFQALSAICITELEAESIIRKYFPGLKATEAKYGALVRRRSNWDRLLDFQRDILLNYECITYICDKKFVLILQFLDDAVEPFYYDRGVDFYKDGSNYLLASLLYYCGNQILGRDKFADILKSYQQWLNLSQRIPFAPS